MVFYRKYRPQSLDQLIGQENVKNTLSQAFQNGNLAHAYLFCGPRGTGKTSTARILAKMVNCQNQPSAISHQPARLASESIAGRSSDKTHSDSSLIADSELTSGLKAGSSFPCNSCHSCTSITDGSNLDVIEIDAASNRGIDDIRTLRENMKLSPSNSKKKVYIIDEVHMLTTEAFNALLKTLEEPPAHVLFILATTEVPKIPQTILSRVQKIDFKLASITDLVTAIQNISATENIEASNEALKLIAKKADGSFRDALKLLDQLSSSGEKIGIEQVENAFKIGNFAHQLVLLEAISANDSGQAITLISKSIEEGINVKEYTHSLMDTLRSLLFIKQNVGNLIKEQYGSGKYQELVEISAKFSAPALLNHINCFQDAIEKLKYASIVSLPLEVALVQCCLEGMQSSDKSTINRHAELTVGHPELVSGSSKVMETSEVGRSRNEFGTTIDSEETKQSISSSEQNSVTIQQSSNEGHTLKDDQIPHDIITLQDKWTYILETVKPFNFSLEALLRSAKLVGSEDNRIIIEVPYSFHQRILETPRNRDMLESIFSEVLGKSVRMSCIIGKRPMRIEEIANIEVAQEDDVVKLAAEIFNSET